MHPRRLGNWHDYFALVLAALGLVGLLLPRPLRFQLAARAGAVLLAPLRALEETRAGSRRLREENRRLELLAAELALENARLHSLDRAAGPPPLTGHDLVRAPVISRDLATLRRYLVVSRGNRAGVSPGAPALVAAGVVGTVIAVAPNQALVQSLHAPESRVAVTNRRSRVPAIARALGVELLMLDYVPKDSDFRPGDTLVTAGLGGIFPSGLPVALVTLARDDPAALFKTVHCRPLAAIARLEALFVLRIPAGAAANPDDDWLDNLAPTGTLLPENR